MNHYNCEVLIFSGEISVKVILPKSLKSLLFSDFLARYIPDSKIEFSDSETYVSKSIILEIKLSEIISFTKTSESLFILNITKDVSHKDIISVIEYILEYNRQLHGIYCIHSSTVIVGEKAFVFWGMSSNLGKTRTALLVADKLNGFVFSDEKTLINLKAGTVCGGINSIYLSKNVYKNRFKGGDFYDLTKIGKRIFKLSALININNLGSVHNIESEVKNWDNLTTGWHLYEELTRKIRGTSRRISGFNYPLISIDTENISRNRLLDITKFLEKNNCLFIRASEDVIIDSIKNILNS